MTEKALVRYQPRRVNLTLLDIFVRSGAVNGLRAAPGWSRPGLQIILVSGVLTVALTVLVPAASADPGVTIPDAGTRPVPNSQVVLPGQSVPGAPGSGAPVNGSPGGSGPTGVTPAAAPPVLGPLATQIITESRAVELLGEQAKQAELGLQSAQASAIAAQQAWQSANERLRTLRRAAESDSVSAYKRATELGPFGAYAHRLHHLSIITPGGEPVPGGEATARDLLQAIADERSAYQAYQAGDAAVRNLTIQRDTSKAAFTLRSTALTELKSRNASELAAVDAQRNAYEAGLGGANLGTVNADRLSANPKALAAMQFALRELGKPYEWAAEGPNRYDCSGLMWAAYRSVGATLPRVAAQQYRGTSGVGITRSAVGDLLLPGDLVFFGPDRSDWTSIHHVGMYIGGGRMVHAPNSNDVVKISPVWWSEFFGASRIFPPVPAPGPPTTPPPVGVAVPPVANPTTSPAPSTPSQPAPSEPVPSEPVPSEPVPSDPPPSDPPPSDPPSSEPPPPSDPPPSSEPPPPGDPGPPSDPPPAPEPSGSSVPEPPAEPSTPASPPSDSPAPSPPPPSPVPNPAAPSASTSTSRSASPGSSSSVKPA